MADEQAGGVFVKVIPDADRAAFRTEIGKALDGVNATLSVALKVGKGEVTEVIAEADAEMAKRKKRPVLAVDLKVAKGEAARVIREANANFKKLKNPPQLSVGLNVTATAAKAAIRDANAKLKAAKVAPPKLSVQLDLDERELTLIRDARVQISKINATLPPIELPVELDEKTLATIAAKAQAAAALVQARIDAAHAASVKNAEVLEAAAFARTIGNLKARNAALDAIVEEHDAKLLAARLSREAGASARIAEAAAKSQVGLQQKIAAGQDAASLEQIRQINRVALAHTRAELTKRTSSNVTLRQLRNDLSQFDASTTRVLRNLTLGFGAFTLGVTAAFAGIAVASLKSFADTEQQLRRTAAVLGTDVFSEIAAKGGTAEEAFAGFRKEVDRTNAALANTINSVAIGTIFDPTEIAQGTRALAQAGLQVDQIKSSLLGVAQFAQNEEILPEEAVQNLVQGATAAGESLSNLTALSDKFTFVANNTTASAKDVADAFANRAAPAFKAYGEQVTATLTVLDLFAASGVKGKTAGEQAGILIREINKAAVKTPATTAAFKKYGIEVGKVNGVQVPFLKTLAQVSTLLQNTRVAKGSLEYAKLRKELGLTEKSGAGLQQILTQITKDTGGSADVALQHLQKLEKQIGRSGGATARQADVLLDTLSFQTDILSNNITTLFKQAAGPLGKALTGVFSELNGEVKIVNGEITQTGGVLGDLGKKFVKVGQQIADVIAPAVARFATGGEGEDFFKGLFEGFRSTLRGVVDSFVAFREAAFGEGSNKGFFTLLGDAFAGVGRFVREALPVIAEKLGQIVGFIRENSAAVKLFVKAWLTLFLASKAIRLFIIPLVSLTDNIGFLTGSFKKLLGLQIAQQLIGATSGMRFLTAETKAATVATNALAAAEARQAAAQAVATATAGKGGFKAFSTKATAVTAGAEVATQKRVAAQAAATAAGVSRLSKVLAVLRGSFVLLAKATIVIPLVFGLVKGAVNQLNEAMGGDGNVSARDFANGMRDVGHAISSVVGPILNAIVLFTKILVKMGELAGAFITFAIIKLFKGLAAAIGFVVDKAKDFGPALERIASSIPIIGPAVGPAVAALKALGDGIDGLKGKIDGGFGPQSTTRIQFGNYMEEVSNRWAPHSKTLSRLFGGVADDVLAHERAIDAEYEKTAQRRKERLKKVADAAAAAAKKEFDATNVLGVANGALIPSYIRLTAVQKAMRLQQSDAVRVASDYQQRQANLAFVMDVLTGKVKNQAAMQKILASSSNLASDNLLKLVGGQDKLKGQLTLIAQGNQKVAASYLKSATAAAYAAQAVTLARASAAQAQLQMIRDAAQGIPSAALTTKLLEQVNAGKTAKATLKGFIADQKALVESLQAANGSAAGSIDDIAGAGSAAGEAAKKTAKDVKTAAEIAEAAVAKMTTAQFRAASDALIAKIGKIGIKYKANAHEAALLAKAIPLVDAALQKQTDLVSKLDAALSKLQETQLKGTKAANDAAFAFTQQQNALELQKVNLQINNPGIKDDDPAIKAIDDQIAALALQARKVELEASTTLDPLKKKLEDTFSPVKELSFEAIIAQFQKLTAAKTKADTNLTKTTELKAKLDAVAAAAADKFSGIGLNVTKGIEAGLAAGNASLVASSKKTANTVTGTVKTQLGIASPSRVMHAVGVDTMAGFNNGIASMAPSIRTTADAIATSVRRILAADEFYIAAGRKVMRGFLAGLKEVYTEKGGVQDFVREIAVWIRDNKGPISYDAQLLRPAGEAMMSGFHGGLRDGFGEIKGWVKTVGPSLTNDAFPKELFFKRSARFLINNAKFDESFNPQDAFGDLTFGGQFGATGGAFGPLSSILHKTLSLADTIDMGQKLMGVYGLNNLTAKEGHSQFTSSGNVSAHFLGRAVDMALAGVQTPDPKKDALYSAMAPFALGKDRVIEQLIYKHSNIHHGSQGLWSALDHMNHVHAEFAAGAGFSINSGKKGVSALSIPGVPRDVLEAIQIASQQYKFDPTIIAAVMKQESGFRKNVVSGDGGYGLMQLTSANLVKDADRLGGRLNPVANALVGTKYLRDLVSQLGSLNLGLSAYNSGPGGGERYGRIDVPAYVASVLRYLAEIRRQAGIGSSSGNRAQGGKVKAGNIYGVNERGREWWVPEKNGSVITNKNVEAMIDAMRSAQTVQPGAQQPMWAPQITVQSNSPDPSTVASLVEARMRAQVTGVRR